MIGGTCYPAAVHIGPNLTFGEHAKKVEVHLLDFSGDLYGKPLDVDIISRLRDVRRFPSADELRAQLQADVENVRRLTSSSASSVP